MNFLSDCTIMCYSLIQQNQTGVQILTTSMSVRAKDYPGRTSRTAHKHTEESAVQMLKRAGATPIDPYPFSLGKPWKCRCDSCGEVISPIVSNLDRGSKACKFCFGSKPCGDKPASVYLIHSEEHRAVKVGVTGNLKNRKSDFAGWKVIEVLSVPAGRIASQIEAEILRIWREDLGLSPKVGRKDVTNKGHSETADEKGLMAALGVLGRHKQAYG